MLMSTLSPLFRQENKRNKMALEVGVAQQDVPFTSMRSKRQGKSLWLRPSRLAGAGLLNQTSFSDALLLLCKSVPTSFPSISLSRLYRLRSSIVPFLFVLLTEKCSHIKGATYYSKILCLNLRSLTKCKCSNHRQCQLPFLNF